jgi:hypothetical protein
MKYLTQQTDYGFGTDWKNWKNRNVADGLAVYGEEMMS